MDRDDNTDEEMQTNAEIYLDYVKSIIGNSDDFFLDTERQRRADEKQLAKERNTERLRALIERLKENERIRLREAKKKLN